MTGWKLCAATCAIAAVTAASSLIGDPSVASPARENLREVKPSSASVYPLVALVAAGGLAGAFALGAVQGYLEEKNEQRKGSTEPEDRLRTLSLLEFENVLD